MRPVVDSFAASRVQWFSDLSVQGPCLVLDMRIATELLPVAPSDHNNHVNTIET